jgi:hypothetical protein
MIERRKLTRLRLLYYLRVFDKDNYRLLGHLGDVHTKGMMLISESPLTVNKNYNIRIALPEPLDKHEKINATARALWCRLYTNPLFYQTGFQIQYLHNEHVQLLESVIQKYGFQSVFQSEAVKFYRGIEGYNCAQAIVKAFQHKVSVGPDLIHQYARYGGGNATDGVCGGLFAIEQLAPNLDLAQQARHCFDEQVGSIFCSDILELGRLSCAGCISVAANILYDILDHYKDTRDFGSSNATEARIAKR